MKLIDAIKEKGKPFSVPDCSRDSLPEFFSQMGYKVGAEVGVFRGEFTEKFCQRGLAMYAIDPWIGYSGAGRSEKVQEKQDSNLDTAKARLSLYKNCTLIRRTSMEAVADFENESLDFVYIDGDHRFRYIAEDLYEWYQKVKRGGVMSGHDYFSTRPEATNVICHVGPVVDAFVETFGIESFYTFGYSENNEQETKNDRTLSWLFFKR